MSDVTDLLGLAVDSNPVEFADKLNDILANKAMEALDNKRIEVAQNMYGVPDESQDDLDLDFGDLDLDDLDLEDLDLDNEEE